MTVTDNRGITGESWTATVTATTFVTGGATAPETIPLTRVTYWSGPATATTGTGTFTPGQASPAAAVSLTVPRTAFSLAGGTSVTRRHGTLPSRSRGPREPSQAPTPRPSPTP